MAQDRPLDEVARRFGEFHHMGTADLARFLGTTEAGLASLAGLAVPEERDPGFDAAIAHAAAQTGASAARLAQVARVTKLLR